ncbi:MULTISPECIES: hypothetical protein [unclassified Pseudomonas]|uniref:hypothetical protein n=1 Tax=unclassified Pseudomonas TaxID=196821 RepID=UPI000A1E47B5|nr:MULTISPECIES: hypothetical protein [unclassified Pseudomonas]
MIKDIKAIAIACTISICSALWFASAAENDARLAAAHLVLEHRNDVQVQFSHEREAMKGYISKAMDRNRMQ